MRGAAVTALVATALVASAEFAALVTPATIAIALALAVAAEFVAAWLVVAALAFEALAWRTVLARFGGCRGFGWRCSGFCGRALAGFAEIAMTVAAAAMPRIGLGTLAAFTSDGDSRLRAILRRLLLAMTAMTVAILMRAALFGAATGAPYVDHLGFSRRFGRSFSGGRLRLNGLRRRRVAGCRRGDRSVAGWLRSLDDRGFGRSRRFGLCFDGRWRCFDNGRRYRRDIGQQPR